MTINLDIAAYNAGKPVPPTPGPTLREIFARKRVYALSSSDSRARTEMIARLRHSTWRRHEAHNKQLQHFMDRERFQQNQTWQAEYDQLRSKYNPGQQHYIDDRMDKLKDLILGRKLDKLEWQPIR